MIALVTGGAGFIGSHLADRLVAQGYRVIVLDNLTKGARGNVEHLLGCGRFELEVGDLRDEAVLQRVADRGPFDVIYHLAAMHYIPECIAQPVQTLAVNVVGTQALLSAVPGRRVVLASTGDVYAPKESPHREIDPQEPFNVYGLSKSFGERVLEAQSRVLRTTTFVVARLFNVYGPRETNPHVIPRIVEEIRKGSSIRLGSVSPRRDYTHVSDTVEALLALGGLESSTPFDVFNVGTGLTSSVEEVVKLFGEILGKACQIELDPERTRSVDRPHLQADTAKIHRATRWQARYSLREGLKQLCLTEGLIR